MEALIKDEVGISIRDYSFIENFYPYELGWFQEINEHKVLHSSGVRWETDSDLIEETLLGKNWEDWTFDETEQAYWDQWDSEFERDVEYSTYSYKTKRWTP